jgi:hypothetical protein
VINGFKVITPMSQWVKNARFDSRPITSGLPR